MNIKFWQIHHGINVLCEENIRYQFYEQSVIGCVIQCTTEPSNLAGIYWPVLCKGLSNYHVSLLQVISDPPTPLPPLCSSAWNLDFMNWSIVLLLSTILLGFQELIQWYFWSIWKPNWFAFFMAVLLWLQPSQQICTYFTLKSIYAHLHYIYSVNSPIFHKIITEWNTSRPSFQLM